MGIYRKRNIINFLRDVKGSFSDHWQRISELSQNREVTKPKLPDITRLTSFETLDLALLLMLVKRKAMFMATHPIAFR